MLSLHGTVECVFSKTLLGRIVLEPVLVLRIVKGIAKSAILIVDRLLHGRTTKSSTRGELGSQVPLSLLELIRYVGVRLIDHAL